MRKQINLIFLAGCVITSILMILVNQHLDSTGSYHQGILGLQFAGRSYGLAILELWESHSQPVNLIAKARQSLWIDLLFIFFYTGLLWRLSYYQMQHEKRIGLNNLLRFSIFLAVVTGLLDITEDLILFYNLDHFYLGNYISAAYIATAKFATAAFVIVMLVVSWFQRKYLRR